MASVKIGWGRTHDGQFIHINEAERGKKCNCTCPECRTPLIARQGDVTSWHFAHSQPVDCYGESVLHRVAKQIISETVGTQKPFLLPALEKEISSNDQIGKEYLTTLQVPERNIFLSEAIEEFRLSNNQISDVLVSDSSQNGSLAVEIYVTHKKSEIDINKFSEIKQDVIEIDLSNTDPLSNRDTLERLVLQEAERYWLFNKEESEQSKIHEQSIDKINQSYVDELMGLVLQSLETGKLNNLSFMWPQLTKNVSKKGIYDEVLFGRATRTPKITELNTERSYKLIRHGCITDAVVANRTRISVCFVLLDSEVPSVDTERPLLVFEYDPNSKQFYLSWFQINKWQERLKELAEKDLQKKIDAEQSKYRNQLTYAKNFAPKPDIEKLQFLAKELSLRSPYNAGQYLDHWNTTWHVWKTLVWKYKIIRKQGSIIDVEHISKDDWFEQLLNWPKTQEAQVKRSKNIWFWFSRELQKASILEHRGSMIFKVTSSVPENFVPWVKL